MLVGISEKQTEFAWSKISLEQAFLGMLENTLGQSDLCIL